MVHLFLLMVHIKKHFTYMLPKILTFGAGQNGKKFRIWFRFCDIWCTILQMVPFYIWCRNIRCMLIILSFSSEIYYLYLCFWSLEMKHICKCNMLFCKNTSLLTGGSSTHKTSAGTWTGIVRCPGGHRPIC